MATAPLLRSAMAHRPVIRALRRRRHLRASLVQLVYVVASFALALVLARLGVGPTIPATTAVPMLFALGGGLLGFIGIVYSLKRGALSGVRLTKMLLGLMSRCTRGLPSISSSRAVPRYRRICGSTAGSRGSRSQRGTARRRRRSGL